MILSEDNIANIARMYEGKRDGSTEHMTRKVYAQFVRECKRQFDRIPVKVIFTASDPYDNSKALFADIEKGVMRVYTGGNEHPLMSKEENNVFRAVHDYYGHYGQGERNHFGIKGEVRAWKRHRRMFSSIAKLALNTETLAQVCYYFTFKRFAEQKAFLTDFSEKDIIID